MDMNDDEMTFYVVYNPEMVRMYFMDYDWNSITIPDYMKKGYFISPFPSEPWSIKFQGSLWKCMNVLRSIDMFVYN